VVAVNFGIFARLIVSGNPEETARNILAHETLFRVGIAGDMVYCVGVVVLLTALYVILKPVSQNLALLAAFGRLVHGLTWLLATLNLFTALRLLRDADYSRAFGPDQLPALARLYLSGFDAYYVGLLFWGLGATVGSYLWFKSNYIPQGTGCLWCDLQRMVRRLHCRLLHLPRLRQSREPVVVRLAPGYLRTSAEFLASV
jgi:Domain of unknown function (DUF4386)